MLFWMLKWFKLDLVQFRDGLLITIVYGFDDFPNALICFAPLYCTLLLFKHLFGAPSAFQRPSAWPLQ